MRTRAHLVEQPRLADAWLAADQRDSHLPRNSVRVALLEPRHLALPPDERWLLAEYGYRELRRHGSSPGNDATGDYMGTLYLTGREQLLGVGANP
jgi:hypothetical protein